MLVPLVLEQETQTHTDLDKDSAHKTHAPRPQRGGQRNTPCTRSGQREERCLPQRCNAHPPSSRQHNDALHESTTIHNRCNHDRPRATRRRRTGFFCTKQNRIAVSDRPGSLAVVKQPACASRGCDTRFSTLYSCMQPTAGPPGAPALMPTTISQLPSADAA